MLRVDMRRTRRAFTVALTHTFAPGITLLTGPSGSGKTTILRAIAGLDGPTSGSIALNDRILDGPATYVPTHQREIGYVFQQYALFPHLDVAANIAYGMIARGATRAKVHQVVEQLLERFEIAALIHAPVGAISGGQRQRVALARALAYDPQALLLDEPLAALDAATRARVREELSELLRATHVPTIIVTHDEADVRAFGGRVITLALPP